MAQLEEKKYKIEDLIDLVASLRNEGVNSANNHNLYASKQTIEMFSEVNKKLDTLHNALYGTEGEGGIIKLMNSINDQTKKTNGRVTKMELWRYGLTTAYTIGTGMIVFFIVYMAIPAYKNQNETISTVDKNLTVHIAQDIINLKK